MLLQKICKGFQLKSQQGKFLITREKVDHVAPKYAIIRNYFWIMLSSRDIWKIILDISLHIICGEDSTESEPTITSLLFIHTLEVQVQ